MDRMLRTKRLTLDARLLSVEVDDVILVGDPAGESVRESLGILYLKFRSFGCSVLYLESDKRQRLLLVVLHLVTMEG